MFLLMVMGDGTKTTFMMVLTKAGKCRYTREEQMKQTPNMPQCRDTMQMI